MVARINTSKNISKALNYNEHKVQQGKAEILSAPGFLKEADEMNFYEKLARFESLTSLNERTETNTLHVSLNFDPSEKLSSEKLVAIACAYMQKIGFSNQPYLVYQHHDAGHPHIHIVSTNIEKDGKRISMHNMGRNQSEKARKEIEISFGLVKASDKKNMDLTKLEAINARKVIYGKSETRRAISNVLGPVIHHYKFSSLPEFNAILKLYNITADRGQEGSRIYNHKGLTYRVLDEQGNKVGVPQKASSFFMKPTLTFLEKKFIQNEPLKQPYKKRLTNAINWTLLSKPVNLNNVIKALEKESISVVLRQNKDGLIYGITYVDQKTKCVFNGSDLGKEFSAKAILEKCNHQNISIGVAHDGNKIKTASKKDANILSMNLEEKKSSGHETLTYSSIKSAIGQNIIGSPQASEFIPVDLKFKKKRKKKRISF